MHRAGFIVILLQFLLAGTAVALCAWAGAPWLATAGLVVLGVCALAAATGATHRGRAQAWAAVAAWVCTVVILAGALLSPSARATLGSYLDGYYGMLAWMMAAALLPASRDLPGGGGKTRWRVLVMLWAMLGTSIWVGASYLGNRSGVFFLCLLVLLALLVLCHVWFRLRAAGIVVVNTLILVILGLPLADLTARCVSSLRAPLEASRQFYLYEAAKKDPVAFGRWWNYYNAQWQQAEKQFKVPDPDPALLYRLQPNTRARVAQSEFVINSRGFRGPEIPAEKGDAYRIVALGESTTFGVTLHRGQRPWPELLEQLIRERFRPHRPVQVINAGVPGYRLDQNLYRFPTAILPLQPDLVISYHGINAFDSLRGALPLGRGTHPPDYQNRPLRLLADAEYRLRLMGFARRPPPKTVPPPASLTDPLATPYAQCYRQLIETARTNHIRLALANYAMAANEQSPPPVVEFYQVGYPDAPWDIQANRVHSLIVRTLAEQHPEVCFVDTHPGLDGEHDKFIDLVHFAPAGEEQLAEAMFKALRPILEADLLRF
jgi:lysophospholipase L1-like esterase